MSSWCDECGQQYSAPRFTTEANWREYRYSSEGPTRAEQLGTMCACYGVPKASRAARAEAAWYLRFRYLYSENYDGSVWYQQARAAAASGILPPTSVPDAPSWSGRLDWAVFLGARIADNERAAPWHAEAWATAGPTAEGEFLRLPHCDPAAPAMVSYVASYIDGLRGKVTQTKPGRYLARFFPGMPAAEVERWAKLWTAEFSIPALELASTPDDIERVYRNGPRSCMSHSPSSYESDVHPVRVYGAGDLAVAYIMRKGSISARVLCWPEKKVHIGRMYGAADYLRAALNAAGYTQGSIDGAKLLMLENSSGGYVMPYLDSSGYAESDCGTHFVVRSTGRSGSQTGVVEGREYIGECDRCGDSVYDGEGDLTEVDGSSWCDYCVENHASMCEHCDSTTACDNLHSVGSESWCEDCAGRDSTVCARCEERVEDDEIAGQTRKGGNICNSCAEDHYIMCSTHDALYRNSREYCPECGPADCAHEGCAEQIDGNLTEYCDKHAEQAAEVGRAAEVARRAARRAAVAGGLALAWFRRMPTEMRPMYGQPADVRVIPGPEGASALAVAHVTGCGRSGCDCSGPAGWRVIRRYGGPIGQTLGPEFPSAALALYAAAQVRYILGAVDTQPDAAIDCSLRSTLRELTELDLLSW